MCIQKKKFGLAFQNKDFSEIKNAKRLKFAKIQIVKQCLSNTAHQRRNTFAKNITKKRSSMKIKTTVKLNIQKSAHLVFNIETNVVQLRFRYENAKSSKFPKSKGFHTNTANTLMFHGAIRQENCTAKRNSKNTVVPFQ